LRDATELNLQIQDRIIPARNIGTSGLFGNGNDGFPMSGTMGRLFPNKFENWRCEPKESFVVTVSPLEYP
jgi:hypothetical protein